MFQDNVDGLRRALDAFNRRDRDAFLAMCHPDIEKVPPRDWPESQSVDGPEGVWDYFVENNDPWDATPLEYVELIDAGSDKVVGLVQGQVRGRASGAGVIWSFWQVTTIRDGKTVRIEWFTDRPEAFEAAGL